MLLLLVRVIQGHKTFSIYFLKSVIGNVDFLLKWLILVDCYGVAWVGEATAVAFFANWLPRSLYVYIAFSEPFFVWGR